MIVNNGIKQHICVECKFCKEKLDSRDILDGETLHCWKCGFKRPLTKMEKAKYLSEATREEDILALRNYYYEV